VLLAVEPSFLIIPVENIILEPEGLTSNMIHIGDKIMETLDYKSHVLLKRLYIR